MTKKITKPMAKTKKSIAIPIKEYASVFLHICTMVGEARISAFTAANQKLLNLYWAIGKIIHERQELSGWGSKFVDRLAIDLNSEFPGTEGLSRSNLFRMRAFYREYSNSRPSVRQFTDRADTSILCQVPWSHNVILLEKVEGLKERLWYAHKAIEAGWSRNVLAMQIESGLYKRQGKAITNFSRTLPAPHSDLAEQVLKDFDL